MAFSPSAAPIGQVVTLDDGRPAWIRVPRPSGEVATLHRVHWRREVVDAAGHVVAFASYELRAPERAVATLWVAPAWRPRASALVCGR